MPQEWIDKIKQYAQEHYNEGGHFIVEAFKDEEIEEEFGHHTTYAATLKDVKSFMKSASNWE